MSITDKFITKYANWQEPGQYVEPPIANANTNAKDSFKRKDLAEKFLLKENIGAVRCTCWGILGNFEGILSFERKESANLFLLKENIIKLTNSVTEVSPVQFFLYVIG